MTFWCRRAGSGRAACDSGWDVVASKVLLLPIPLCLMPLLLPPPLLLYNPTPLHLTKSSRAGVSQYFWRFRTPDALRLA